VLSALFKSDSSSLSLKDPEVIEKSQRESIASLPENLREILDPGSAIEKNQIYYHRSYRKLKQHSLLNIAVQVLVQIVLIDFFIFYYYPQITEAISKVTKAVLATAISQELIEIVPSLYIYDNVHVVTLPGRYPSLKLSIIVAVLSLTFFFLSISLKRVIEPKFVWLIFISFINLTASLFFIFYSGYFPYDMEVFSEMYIKTEVGIWIIIPFILTIALLPFPIKMIKKVGVIILTILYSMVFALVRYIVFLYLLRTTTYLFMALMFFMLGPFLDFIYIVGSYSLCLSTAGKQTQKKMELWNWLF